MLTRRGFLQRVVAVVTAAVVVPYAKLRAYSPWEKALIESNRNLFNPSADVAKAYREGAMSIRFVRDWTIDADTMQQRLDVLYGSRAIQPEFICRVASETPDLGPDVFID